MYAKGKILLFITLFIVSLSAQSTNTTLVDFGASQSQNIYGLSGWDQLLLSSKMSYTFQGTTGVKIGSGFDETNDFMGVKGSSRLFTLGERIVVTWFNNSSETVYFSSRVSFTDEDQPDGGSDNGNWYTMRSFDDYRNTYTSIAPNSSAKTVFNITDTGVHKTDSAYSVVNINLIIDFESSADEQKQFLVCDKIELYNDADLAPPSKPGGLSASEVTDTKATLSWNAPSDNVGVAEYLIYRDGEIEGYSRSNNYTAVFLEPNKSYNFSVSALDKNRNESLKSDQINLKTLAFSGNADLINPAGFEYLGAFIAPEDFSYGGEALAFKPSSSSNGTLYISDVNQEERSFVGEISIPALKITDNMEELNVASIITDPVNIRPANVNSWPYVDVWRIGLEYVQGENRLYSSWGYHYQVGDEKTASISCCDANNLSGSTKYGAWFAGSGSSEPIDRMLNDYLFQVPQDWANTNIAGKSLITGRYRDGGLSGLGPTMYAFSPFGSAVPPAAGNELNIITLLKYGTVVGTDNYNYPNSIDGYKHSDMWRDADWISVNSQNAIMVIGNKAFGDNWYGYNGERMLHTWVIADIPYPEFYETDINGKGWKSHRLAPMAILYNPEDIIKVANNTLDSFEPQPYAAVRFDKNIFFGQDMEITSCAFDQENSLLYVNELAYMNDGRLIIHVFKINYVESTTSVNQTKIPEKFELHQNYPNPFNPSTTITYHIPGDNDEKVILTIYDSLGRKIKTLVDNYHSAGKYEIKFNAENLSSGIYYYKLTSGIHSETKKMILVK